MKSTRYRILALDVDGTLLDADGTLRPATAGAVGRAAQAGVRPILCTGRRYRRARPIARQLGLEAPIVCNSGSIIKDPVSHSTIWRADFDVALATAVLEFFAREEQPPVIFTDRHPDLTDFVVPAFPTGQRFFDDYVAQNLEHADINPTICAGELPAFDNGERHCDALALFHVCAIGERSEMQAFQRTLHERVGDRIQTFVQRSPRYLGTMCEIVRHDADKWRAILHLARLWGVAPTAICAIGDDVNDIPMLKSAGLGIAMGHASPEVRASADLVIGNDDQNALAALVDEILLAD
jgi:Cof subfamily protein (haloacid dehalogenase superfamily)